jgi:AraC family transcriptional regulator of adaptative response/methylated-DNA-[protein]-cysteine methyltransferase
MQAISDQSRSGGCVSPIAIAILVPRHRVLKKDGSISGSRWGVRRKRALLEREQLAPRGRK